jgi:hypothetical protein
MKVKRKRGHRWRDAEQEPTRAVTIEWIMAQPHFMLGVADVRAGRDYPRDYDSWTGRAPPSGTMTAAASGQRSHRSPWR